MGRIFKYYLGAQIPLNVSVIHIPRRTLGNAAPHINNDKNLAITVETPLASARAVSLCAVFG